MRRAANSRNPNVLLASTCAKKNTFNKVIWGNAVMSKLTWRLNVFQIWMVAAAAWWTEVAAVWLEFVLRRRGLVTIDHVVWLAKVLVTPPIGLYLALFVVPRRLHWTASRP